MNLYDQVWQIPGYCANGLDRAREVLDDLVWHSKQNAWLNVLDVGCGRGHVVQHLRGVDIYACGIDPFLPEPGPHLLRGDLATLASLDCSVDIITSFDMLEHLNEDSAYGMLRTMAEVAPRACLAIANMSDVHDVAGVPTELHPIQQPAEWWAQMVKDAFSSKVRIQPLPYPARFFIWAGDWKS